MISRFAVFDVVIIMLGDILPTLLDTGLTHPNALLTLP